MAIDGLSSITRPIDRSGLVCVASTSFTTAASVSVDNCFTSAYDNYRVVIEFSAASTSLTTTVRMRAAGADSSAASYNRIILYSTGTVATANQSAQTSWTLAAVDATQGPLMRASLDFYTPQAAKWTLAKLASPLVETGPAYYDMNGSWWFTANTQFDGFSLIASTGNISGTVRVYGYRNTV